MILTVYVFWCCFSFQNEIERKHKVKNRERVQQQQKWLRIILTQTMTKSDAERSICQNHTKFTQPTHGAKVFD